MSQFTRKSTRRLPPSSYEAAARKLDKFAADLRARKDPQSPREQGALTQTIHGLSLFAQALSRRHRAQASQHVADAYDADQVRREDYAE